MKKNQIITIANRDISITQINDEDYISLTNMVGDKGRAADVIKNWLRNKGTLEFLGVWERLYNQAGLDRFVISVKEWVRETNAIGIISKAGRGGGTYAHRDIAFEFGSRISAEFKLFLVRELHTTERRRVQP